MLLWLLLLSVVRPLASHDVDVVDASRGIVQTLGRQVCRRPEQVPRRRRRHGDRDDAVEVGRRRRHRDRNDAVDVGRRRAAAQSPAERHLKEKLKSGLGIEKLVRLANW